MSSHVGDRLSPFMDGELPPHERGEVEAHLRDCAECASELAGLAALDAMAREIPVSAPDGYFDSFPARVRERMKSRPARRAWQQWTWAAAAALLLAVLTPLTLMETRRHSPASVDRPATTTPPVLGEVAQEPVATKSLPDTTVPRDERFAEKGVLARERQKEQPSPDKLAAPPAAPAAPRPVAPAATPAPKDAVGGFAAPPAVDTGANDAPPPGDERLRDARLSKRTISPTPWPSEQHGPRAQAQAPSSTQEAQGGYSQDLEKLEKPKPRSEPGRLAAAEEKRRNDQAGDAAAKKAEEGVERDGAKSDADAKAASTLGYAASRTAPSSDETVYRSLAARPVASAAGARELREAWRGFLKAHPQSGWADQARVRMIEASLAAWRLGRDAADLETLRRDRDAYLRRPDAAHKERVRELLPESER